MKNFKEKWNWVGRLRRRNQIWCRLVLGVSYGSKPKNLTGQQAL
jgi:hypothetical protein